MNQEKTDTSFSVGDKIKKLRETANVSLEELAQRAGLDATELYNIEQNMISPALGVLTRICDGLGVRLGHFFDQGPRKLYTVVRKNDQKMVTRFASKSGTDYGYEYYSLGAEKRKRVMEPFVISIHPPSDPTGRQLEPEKLQSHNGEEFIFVLEGAIEVQLEDQSFVLHPGDSVYYDASVPHRVIHHGKTPSRSLAVIHLPNNSSET